ncbi:sensor histidine kinase [Ornithinibacillus sp. 4-3]|uniref:histidine kinase n=1 Tax=Ornithinibacillus sp. 4-3 TaxID=3231488 RepID=A0AB39HPM9_9BACI
MKLQRRIAFHFTFQFFVLFAALFFFVIVLLLMMINLFTNEEIRINAKQGLISNIPLMATIDGDEVSLEDNWIELLEEHDMWLQIINEEGEVLSEFNTPDDLAEHYTINDILQIEEEKQLGEYNVSTSFSTWLTDSYYFLFGFYHPGDKLLDKWIKQYGDQKTIDEADIQTLEQQLTPQDAVLYIYENNEIIQSVGDTSQAPENILELLMMIHEPGENTGNIAFRNLSEQDTAWVIHFPADNKPQETRFFKRETQVILYAGLISLAIAVLFSIWNGYRYGRPLYMMMKWIGRIDDRKFQLFTEKEKQKVFKKNGKTRRKYRLYEEVIQELQTMSEKLTTAEAERTQLERTREEWMAGISHDIRTPLSSIHGYGHLLESNQYTFSQDEIVEIGKTIREKGDHIVQLVNDFSLVFELKNNVIKPDKQMMDISHFVEETIHAYQKDLTLQNTKFSFSSEGTELFAEIDRNLFIRALDNVIGNAIKHNPAETHISIHVDVATNHDAHTITIVDNGIGMDEEELATLFDRYHRGTNTKEQKEGSGLGMNITKGIIELHGGTIDVESKPGEGTRIIIQIPKT